MDTAVRAHYVCAVSIQGRRGTTAGGGWRRRLFPNTFWLLHERVNANGGEKFGRRKCGKSPFRTRPTWAGDSGRITGTNRRFATFVVGQSANFESITRVVFFKILFCPIRRARPQTRQYSRECVATVFRTSRCFRRDYNVLKRPLNVQCVLGNITFSKRDRTFKTTDV